VCFSLFCYPEPSKNNVNSSGPVMIPTRSPDLLLYYSLHR